MSEKIVLTCPKDGCGVKFEYIVESIELESRVGNSNIVYDSCPNGHKSRYDLKEILKTQINQVPEKAETSNNNPALETIDSLNTNELNQQNAEVNGSKINDEFWFDVNKEDFLKTHERINYSGEKLEKLVVWAWSIYTSIIGLGATGLVGISLTLFHPFSVLFMLSPIFILPIAYWFLVKTQSSAKLKIEDIKKPDSIKQAFFESIQEKNKNLKYARYCSALGIGLIPFIVLLSIFGKDSGTPKIDANLADSKIHVMVSYKSNESKNFKLYLNNDIKAKQMVSDGNPFRIEIPVTDADFINDEIIMSIEFEEKEEVQRIGKKIKKKKASP